MMPTFLGEPFYPMGLPLNTEQVSYEGKTIKQIFLDNIDAPTTESENILKEYIIYYINAPMFDTEELDGKDLQAMTLDELIMECLDIGIDPL